MFQENPEMPRFQIGGFSPELRDNNHAELGFKEYCVKIRVSAEGVPAEDKKFIVIFTEDLSQDPVQISKIGKDVLEGDNMVDLHDCEHYASFKDLPEAVCRRLLRYKTALLQGLRAVQENRK